MYVPRLLRRAPVLLGLFLAACAHTSNAAAPRAASAEGLYREGVEAMETGLYPEATRAFEALRQKHPYARHAALAELRLGDVEVKQGKFIEAVETFRSFLKFHPAHPDSAYAQYMIAEGYFAQLPHDWWFLPPSAEKDPGNVVQAIAAYDDLLARVDDGPMAETARAHRADCRRRLARHELYVARFYLDQRHFAAATARAEQVLDRFGGLGVDAEALLIAGRARVGCGDSDGAVAALTSLTARFPASREARDAARLLRGLRPAT